MGQTACAASYLSTWSYLGCDETLAAFWDNDEGRLIEKREQTKINWQGSMTEEGKDRKAWSLLF